MNGQKRQDGLFRTRDLPLAAFLALHQIEHVSMERQGKHGFWVFKRSDHLEQLIAIYDNGEVTIDLRNYLDCVSRVRSELYAFLDIE